MPVFRLDKRKRPLMPHSARRARLLLERGRARRHRMVLSTIRLDDRRVEDSVVQPVRLKWDPGSKTTRLALVRETTLAWVQRLRRWAPVTALSQGLVRLDRQALQSPEISGAGYQQGTLFEYEARGYLTRRKSTFGFQTGDMARAVMTTGRKVGTGLGRVAVRASGSFNIQTGNGLIQGIHHRFCALIQRTDGYGYSSTPRASTQRDAGMGQASPAALSLPGMNPGVSRANG